MLATGCQPWFDSLLEDVKRPIARRQELTEDDLWKRHEHVLWRADKFLGNPTFYPVYRYKDYYSFSPLALITLKGYLDPDPGVVRQATKPNFLYTGNGATIDREITRVGGPSESARSIKSPQEFAQRIAEALVSDLQMVEKANPNTTNAILCGGRDSLNLLLLPWQNPVLVLSARPNYDLVRRFVRDNGLSYEVVELLDPPDSTSFNHEVAENCCRTNLEHARWGVHLKQIAEQLGRRAIFWKGQLADLYMTTKWMSVRNHSWKHRELAPKIYERLSSKVPLPVREGIACHILEPTFRRTVWSRSAMWQGAHVSIVRAITGCLTLSAYHGTAMTKVLQEVNLCYSVPYDVRQMVGEILASGIVRYPESNPGPDPSDQRQGMSGPAHLFEVLRNLGIRVAT